MSKNLFDYGEENVENLNEEKLFNSNDSNNTLHNNDNNFKNNSAASAVEEEAKTLYEKYKDYSQDNLIQEFLSTSKEKLMDGSLSQDKINSTANALLPYLNDSQKQMMKSLLEQLK